MARHWFAAVSRRVPTTGAVALLVSLAWPASAGHSRTASPAPTTPAGLTRRAASDRGDLEVLRAEIAELRSDLAALRRELTALRRPPPAVAVAPAPTQPPPEAQPPAVPIEVLQTQVEELAQSKVGSGSRFPVTLSGTILSNTVYNSGDANWLEGPNLVGTTSTGSMTSTLRQSRIGVDVGVIPVGGWNATGRLILDFFGGTPGFVTGTVMGLPRLLYAFGRLEHGGTAIEIGQDHVLLAPRDPTSLAALSFPQFFRSGNLYLRAPQARIEQRLGAFTAKAGIVAPVIGDAGPAYVFAPPAGAGERSERPAFEAHLGFDRGTETAASEVPRRRVGPLRLEPVRTGARRLDRRRRRLPGPRRARSAWPASSTPPTTWTPTAPGWRSAAARKAAGSRPGSPPPSAVVHGGAGRDRRPDGLGPAGRLRNTSAFGNAILRLTPEVAASVEYKWLETRYGPATGNRENHHVNAVFAVTF